MAGDQGGDSGSPGCAVDPPGNARDPALPARLVAVLGTIDELSPRLWLEAVRQGVRTAVQVVWLSDGGRGLWSVFQRLFQAVAILDFYHAAQNLYKGASAWLDGRTRVCQQWFADLRHRLRHGHEQHVLAELAALVEATHLPQSARQTFQRLQLPENP